MTYPEFGFRLPPETQRALKMFAEQVQGIRRELAASIVIPKVELPHLSPNLILDMQVIAKRMAESVRWAWPPNWEDDGWEVGVMLARMDIISTEGLPLIWVPRADLVGDLTAQDDADARTALLLERADDALDACGDQLGHVEDGGLVPIAKGVHRALDAWRSGHRDAVQALATAALDTTITRSYGLGSRTAAREFGLPLEEVSIGVVRQAMVLAAVHRALDTFDPIKDPIPTRYNRHATVHAVSPEQYNEANALIALLLATSLVRERHADLNPE